MPHIKVKPFDTNRLDSLKDIKFRGKKEGGNSEIILLKKKNTPILLDIIKRESEYLIKPNKVGRIANTHLLKESLNSLAKELELEVILSNTAIRPTKVEPKSEFLKSIEDFYDFKSSFSNIKLEIGFGSGRHLLYQAQKEPETLFIGVEIHTPSINQLLKQIALKEIKNIYVVNYDARLLLEMLPSNILDTIYIHFPVPWDKKEHRRVLNSLFVDTAIRVLKKGGKIELRTDSINYYKYALELFSEPKRGVFLVEKNIDIEVSSKYEDRWKRMNKDIYTISFYSLENSKDLKMDIEFGFEKGYNLNRELPKEAIVKEDYFVHFGDIFKGVKEGSYLVEVSFGSFNMPEKKFIYIDGESVSYLPTNPVKSFANYKADKLIKEVLENG
ncbi:MAG: tRNA (guanosine(46)-N7)-methyltransferase TrmB [Epsilonproteobacteria bacterium]|nr:tRNA (guanosine(46)-N7)-methyltransferase TrmB [Campylobacterota bacterium]